MRRSYRIALSALLLVMLAACTFVYSSTVTVKISGIEGTADDYPTVYVYAFTDSAAWERAEALIRGEAAKDQEPGAFEDYLASLMPDGCYQMQTATYAETTILGNVSGTAVSFRILRISLRHRRRVMVLPQPGMSARSHIRWFQAVATQRQ